MHHWQYVKLIVYHRKSQCNLLDVIYHLWGFNGRHESRREIVCLAEFYDEVQPLRCPPQLRNFCFCLSLYATLGTRLKLLLPKWCLRVLCPILFGEQINHYDGTYLALTYGSSKILWTAEFL